MPYSEARSLGPALGLQGWDIALRCGIEVPLPNAPVIAASNAFSIGHRLLALSIEQAAGPAVLAQRFGLQRTDVVTLHRQTLQQYGTSTLDDAYRRAVRFGNLFLPVEPNDRINDTSIASLQAQGEPPAWQNASDTTRRACTAALRREALEQVIPAGASPGLRTHFRRLEDARHLLGTNSVGAALTAAYALGILTDTYPLLRPGSEAGIPDRRLKIGLLAAFGLEDAAIADLQDQPRSVWHQMRTLRRELGISKRRTVLARLINRNNVIIKRPPGKP
jgi:hypothetical protein